MEEISLRVKKLLADRGWDELRPSDLAKSVMIEGAELLEIFQWDNQPPAQVKEDAQKMERIRKELADVMIYCLEMAVILGIDMERAVADKVAKAEEKYPVELFNKDARASEPGTEAAYREVKERYRREGKS